MKTTVVFLLSLLLCCCAVKVDYGNPDAFEGDIGLDPGTRSLVDGNLSPGQAFKGTLNRKWPGGVIPYSFDQYLDARRRQLMQNAMQDFHKVSCVRFVPRNNQRDYVRIVNQNACWSIIGRSGGPQLLKMGNHCLQRGTAIHELMHAVGFFHEQSRADRDNHVVIWRKNIQKGQEYNFNKYRTNYYGIPYDLNSIMHYRNSEFSGNGRHTIEKIGDPYYRLGNKYFSTSDVLAINKMYGCGGFGKPTFTPACRDNHDLCWFYESVGECMKSRWVLTNCMKSCMQCVG